MARQLPPLPAAHPASREARIRAFIARVPPGAIRLMLAAQRDEGGPLVLWDVPVEAAVEDAAPLIMQMAMDYLQEAEEHEVTCLLQWVGEADRVLASMPVKVRATEAAAQEMASPMGLDTSPKGQILQQMQQNERMHKVYTMGLATLMANQNQFVDRATGMNERLLDRLTELEERIGEKEAELDAMADLVRKSAAQAEDAIREGGSGAVERGIETLLRMLPLLSGQRALPRQSPPPAPTPQTPPSDAG